MYWFPSLTFIGIALLFVGIDEQVFSALISAGLSWKVSFLLPQVFIVLSSALGSLFMWHALGFDRTVRLVFTVLGMAGVMALHVVLNPPYVEDFSKKGDWIAPGVFDDNQLQSFVADNFSGFHGLIVIASPGCVHCEQAARKLQRMKQRSNASRVLMVMYTNADSALQAFVEQTAAFDLEYLPTPHAQATLEACNGRFPTFFYFANGRFIHRWSNEQFGYPALDWIESGTIHDRLD